MGTFPATVALGLALIGAAFGTPSAKADPTAQPWAGVYVGASVGGAWNNTDWTYFGLPAESVSRDASGFFAGVHAGAQTQWDHLVIGVELSYSGGAFDKIDDRGPDAPLFAATFDSYARLHNLFTVGPRLGWAFNDRWMIFATGGFAQASVETAFLLRAAPNVGDFRTFKHEGWFVGGGFEYALTPNWLVGVEYQHIELDTELIGPFPSVPATSRFVTPDIDVVRARISFKLGLPEPAREDSLK